MVTNKVSGILIILFFIVGVFLFPQAKPDPQNPAAAVDEETLLITDTANQGIPGETSTLNTFSAWDFIRMLLVLGGVLAFIYLIFFILKKAGSPRIISSSTISVLSSQNLESGRSLHLVEVGPQVFLIGSGEGSVRLISEITDKEALDTIKLDKSVNNESSRTFTDTFLGLFRKGGNIDSKTELPASGFLRNQRERLKKM
ncbi:MAG: flagellar biosynthetic protein FliO [Spirochaetales bacterium]|nr:flagellar biosynthetic protein FliO [Spirochaetales bacterium]